MNSHSNSTTTEAPPRCEVHDLDMELIAGQRTPQVPGGVSRPLPPAWVCPKCSDQLLDRAAAASHDEHDRRRRDEAAKQRQAELERRLGAAGIPERYRGFDFDTFPGTTARSRHACLTLRTYANRWRQMQRDGIGALLIGGTGTGKTGLACSVANKVMREEGATASFMTAYGAVRHMRDTWGRRGKTEREALDDLLDVDLLILDEVGASVGTDAEVTALFEVINGRYAARKPTFLLSNLPMDDYEAAGQRRPGLRTFLGPRVIDRFRDDGSFTLAFDWPSLRGGTR